MGLEEGDRWGTRTGRRPGAIWRHGYSERGQHVGSVPVRGVGGEVMEQRIQGVAGTAWNPQPRRLIAWGEGRGWGTILDELHHVDFHTFRFQII